MHHLHRTAGQAKCHRPQRTLHSQYTQSLSLSLSLPLSPSLSLSLSLSLFLSLSAHLPRPVDEVVQLRDHELCAVVESTSLGGRRRLQSALLKREMLRGCDCRRDQSRASQQRQRNCRAREREGEREREMVRFNWNIYSEMPPDALWRVTGRAARSHLFSTEPGTPFLQPRRCLLQRKLDQEKGKTNARRPPFRPQ